MKEEENMRKNIIIGNWKMNKTDKSALKFIKAVDPKCKNLTVDAGIAAPSLWLKELKANSKNLIIAAENCHFESKGAFTGEISIDMLDEIKITHVIVGHSERRQMFNETNETVNLKVIALLAKGLIPIICCGETLKEYEGKKTLSVVSSQITAAFKGVDKAQAVKTIVAYEPIWAIGTGKTATSQIAQGTCKAIREVLAKIFDKETAEQIRIQYGGSVKPANVKELLSQPDIDGALVGGASVEEESFLQLIK